jgi:hypothetical protein
VNGEGDGPDEEEKASGEHQAGREFRHRCPDSALLVRRGQLVARWG